MAVKNLERLLNRIAALPDRAAEAGAAVLQENASTLASSIKQACAVPEIAANVKFQQRMAAANASPGSVANAKAARGLSWQVIVTTSKRVEPGHKYPKVFNPRWEEFGTRPHNVARKILKVGRGGRWERGGTIMHPGARRRPFFWPTVRANKKTMKSRVVRAMNKAAREAAKAA